VAKPGPASRVTSDPAHADVGPLIVTAGATVTNTGVGVDVAVQPFASVMVTL